MPVNPLRRYARRRRVTVLEPGGRSAPMHTETTTAIDPTTTAHTPIAFPDGEFRLFCAMFGSAYGDARKVFRVRVDRDPHERAAEKGIRGYDRIVAVLDPELSGPTAATPASARSSATRWRSSSCAGRRCSGSARRAWWEAALNRHAPDPNRSNV